MLKFHDGTQCEYCSNLIITALGLDYVENKKVFCCKECADDYKELAPSTK